MFLRVFKSNFAIILTIALCIPLASCAQNSTNSQTSENEQVSAEGYRWENFDDGSDVLSLDVPYISSNANSLDFNIILEKGKLANSVDASAVGLSAALSDWSVDSAARVDDVTLEVKLSRPGDVANNGAAVAGVSISADAIILKDTESETNSASDAANASDSSNTNTSTNTSTDTNANNTGSQNNTDTILSSDEVNEMKGVEWPDDATIINQDEAATSTDTGLVVADTPDEVSALLNDIEAGKISSEDDLKSYEEKESAEQEEESVDEAGSSTDEATSDATTSDTATNDTTTADAASAQAYEVFAVFANPALSVDFSQSEINGSSFKAHLIASDFALSNTISAESFNLEGAQGCSLTSAKVLSESELEVELSLPNSSDTSVLEGALLTLKGKANESEADVPCSIEVPKAWLDLQFDYADTSANTITLAAQLNCAQGELTTQNVDVLLDGQEVSPISVSLSDTDLGDTTSADASSTTSTGASSTGAFSTDTTSGTTSTSTTSNATSTSATYSIVLDAISATQDSLVQVSVSDIKDELGNSTNIDTTCTLVDLGDESRGIEKLDPENLLPTLGEKSLLALAEFGWEKFYTNVIDPEYTTGLYDVSNNEVLKNVIRIQEQISDLTFIVNTLSNNVLTGQKASTINSARTLLSRIKTEELQLCDQVNAIYKTSDPVQREEKLRSFATSKEKTTIDNLATDLGVLYDTIMSADSATGHDLVAVYDEMMALSYNWGAQIYPARKNFRTTLATAWANGAQIVSLAYGIQTKDYDAGNLENGSNRHSYLETLDKQTQDVKKLITEKHAIDVSVYRHGGDFGDVAQYANYTDDDFEDWLDDIYDNDFDLWGDDIEVENIRDKVNALKSIGAGKDPLTLYCNTTGSWYQTLNGADTKNKWDNGFEVTKKDKGFLNYNQYSASPFREYKNRTALSNWDDDYMNTEQAKTMASRLHDGQTLKTELENLGFKTTKYLVTSEKFDHSDKIAYVNNDWYFDTFEVAKAKSNGEGFTKNKKHYDASDRYAVVTLVKHVNWYTSASDMFVLKKTKVA